MSPSALLVAVVLGLVLVWAIWVFNRLVRLRNQVRTAWADVDVQLLRRHDLVPNLVAVVQGYAAHERATLEAVTALRSSAVAAHGARPSPAALGPPEAALAQGVTRLLALQEAYPALKANENFLQLHRDLVEVEEQLQFARRFYNGAVRDLNDAEQRFPDLLVAKATAFRPAEFFEAEPKQRETPSVQ